MFCLTSCGSDPAATTPSTVPSPIAIPIPTPTPTPAAENLQTDTYCVPNPAPLHNVRVKVQSDRGFKKILDSRGLVGPDANYCAAIGQLGSICVVRDEGDPMAVTCNNLIFGKADTGRYGPNWFWNDQPCRNAGEGDNEPGCRNHETNQFLVYAFGPGVYAACSADGICNSIEIQ
jgi:hypothetical protein